MAFLGPAMSARADGAIEVIADFEDLKELTEMLKSLSHKADPR
jgi:hypothetical protein